MVNYNNGKIYKIEPLNGEEGDIYIGSTTKKLLSQRMDTHRRDYKRFLNVKTNNVTSFNLFDKYGVENCKIILLELVNVNSKDELLIREAHYIKILKCVNKQIPLQTNKEWTDKNKEYLKEYRKEYNEINKEHRKEIRQIYTDINKDILTKKNKEWRNKNKEYLKIYNEINKERRQKYCEKNKEKMKEYAKQYYKNKINKIIEN